MNLFGNQNKKFEKKLKQQFEDLEYKPSESLWEKISVEIPEDNFENVFAENVNSFEPKINTETWNKIETQLPKFERKNYRIFWIPLLFLFFGSAAYFGYQFVNGQLAMSNEQVAISNKQLAISNKQVAKSKMKFDVGGRNLNVEKKKINNSVTSSENKISIQKNQNEQSKKVDRKNIKSPTLISENKNVVNQKSEKIISKPVQPFGGKVDVNKISAIKNTSISSEKSSVSNEVSTFSHQEIKQNTIANSSSSETKIESSSNTSIPKTDSILASIIPPVQETKNNIADSILPKNSSQNISDDEKLTRFSITAISGMNYCYNYLSAPSNSTINFSQNIALRKNIETPMMDWNGAFLLDYAINSTWRVSTGLMVSNFSQQFQYAIQTPTGNHSSISDPSAKINNANDSIVNGNSYNNRIKYTWTEIPLFVTYSFTQKHKIGIEITTGISYAIISGVDAAYVSYDNVGVLVLTDKTGFPGVKNNFFFHFYPTITYKLNELVQIGISPTFKYSITSITENANWVNQQPYFIGLSASLRKKF